MIPLPFRAIGIVGLGQMGGSIALAARQADPRLLLLGFDPDPKARAAARHSEVFTVVTPDPRRYAGWLDLLVLACPMPGILRTLEAMRSWEAFPTAVTDVGSVKAPIVKAMARLPRAVAWIGGHPLAGIERAGWGAASADRFRGERWFLTRERRGLGSMAGFVRALGARPETVPAARHDWALARTSHALYLASCAVVAAAREAGLSAADLRRFGGSGWRDMTRLALSDPGMAGGYVQANAPQVSRTIREIHRQLALLVPSRKDLPRRLSALRALTRRSRPY